MGNGHQKQCKKGKRKLAGLFTYMKSTTKKQHPTKIIRLVHLYEEPPHALSGPTSSLKPQTEPKLLTIAPKVSSFKSEFHKNGKNVLYNGHLTITISSSVAPPTSDWTATSRVPVLSFINFLTFTYFLSPLTMGHLSYDHLLPRFFAQRHYPHL